MTLLVVVKAQDKAQETAACRRRPGRASIGHARPHPPPREGSSPGKLERVLRRCPHRLDRRARRVPKSVEQWGWRCGFYPRDGHVSGTAESFDQARADFERAWHDYLPHCTPDDFDEHRYQRAFTDWKHCMWDTGCKLPTQMP